MRNRPLEFCARFVRRGVWCGKLGSFMAEFEIPLLSESSHQAIETSFSRSDIIELADDCGREFENDGPEAILKQYSLLHSVTRRFNELDVSMRERYWMMTLQALEGLCQNLGSLEIATLSANGKKQLRNTTKMLCYIAVRMVELYERDTSPQATAKKKKPRPPGDESRVVGGVPANGKQQIVCLLSQLSELEIVCLWDPPSAQMMENWSGLVAQLCYKLLENSSISKDQSLRDRVIHLLGVLIRDYGQALSVALKVIQLLQHFDHLVSILANAVATFTTQFNCKNVAVEIVRELGGKDPRDLSIDSSGTRSFASFLVELCHLVPECVLLSVSVLLPHLNGESYTFRNGVLGVMAELLLHLHKSPLDDQSRQLRDSLFTKLEDHIHDTNAFVRVKVLQLLLQLITAQAVPLPRVHTEVTLVAGRLRDKSSSVRKNALQLLTAWLTHNPFSGKLSRAEFEEKLLVEQNHLRQLVGDGEREERGERDGEEEESGKALKQAAVVQYYTDALQFINALQDCVPTATQLLGSKVASDVLEALEFLCTAEQFSLSDAAEGLRKAMVLVWSRDENIRKALLNTYIKIYFTFDPKTTRTQRTTQIIDNLLLLTQHSTVGELASLHRLVGELVEAGHIPLPTLKALMELCVGCHGDRSRIGMQLLVMVSSVQPTIIRSNLDAFVSTGFTQNQTNPDLLLAKYACQVIQNLAVSDSKAKSGKGKSRPLQSAERLPSTHLMFSQLLSLLVSQLTVTSDPHWCPLAEQAIGLAYKLSSHPDKFAEQLLKEIVRKTFANDSTDGDVNLLVLSRLLFCVGQIAFLQIVHCEVVIAMELKNKRTTMNVSGKTSSSARKSVGGDDGLELTGASAEDTEAELIKKILETEVGGAGGLLSTFEPLIVGVVTNPSKYSCPTLQTSASLALAKYMLISSSLCEKYVQLFFTVLEKSSLECVRANTVIAASDLACRFPNLLEPWTPYIYSRLRDPSPLVRRNALTVLTHLILNDMVKVRGQISSVAICLEDSNPKIADLAKLFFHELAQKGNALYNILPDIISHLSDPSTTNAANQNSFQNIVKFLFGFIQKDRLCESLVEKLCHRFRATRSVEQDHDLAYCLTLLPVTERTLRKLQENLSCYQDKLVDTHVYTAFSTIISKLKKLSKPDLKTAVEEFEQRLQEIHTKGLGQEGRREEEEGRLGELEEEAVSQQGQVEDKEIKSSSPQPPNSEDFSNDVLTSARKQLVSATPTTPLSLSAQGKRNVIREGVSESRNQETKLHTGRRKRRVVDSSESETENQSPQARLQLDCSSDSDFTQ